MKLIYHNTDDSEQYSPFDSELMSLANGQNLCLVPDYSFDDGGNFITFTVQKLFCIVM